MGRRRGGPAVSCRARGNQFIVGHRGRTAVTVALSVLILWSTLPMMLKGGKQYACILDQLIEKASIATAPGSGFQETYVGSLWFIRDAKRSTLICGKSDIID